LMQGCRTARPAPVEVTRFAELTPVAAPTRGRVNDAAESEGRSHRSLGQAGPRRMDADRSTTQPQRLPDRRTRYPMRQTDSFERAACPPPRRAQGMPMRVYRDVPGRSRGASGCAPRQPQRAVALAPEGVAQWMFDRLVANDAVPRRARVRPRQRLLEDLERVGAGRLEAPVKPRGVAARARA
jgi:hypothetical protein